MSCKTATSMYEQYWIPWDVEKRDIWVREMPKNCINIDNHQFGFYTYGMMQEDLYAAFGGWYHKFIGKGKGKTVGLVGIRAQESLNRWRAINQQKSTYKKLKWTTKIENNVYAAYPIYDWKTEDIWIANARYGFSYNKLYDLFYYAGVPLHSMRVASPFNDWAIGSLKLYRVIEPDIWAVIVGRVQGANFSAIYGGTKATGWRNIELPPGHTWQSYVQFLLLTLPDETRKTYEEKFATSIEFWRNKGGVLSNETIDELKKIGIEIKENGKSNYHTDKTRVIFEAYPDDLEVKEFQSVPTYKRMAICIMKNDHLCKYMGFSQTQEEAKRREKAIEKYKDL
jgi:predicted phosphoadenosine phosphosulfate sulfurtransferase